MVLNINDITKIFSKRHCREITVLTWKGFRKIKFVNKNPMLRDIWDAFCKEFEEQRQYLDTEVANMRRQIEGEKAKNNADLVISAPGYIFEELRVLFKELESQLTDLTDDAPSALERIRLVLAQDYGEQFRIVEQMEKHSVEHMERLNRRLDRMAKDLQLSEGEATRLRVELAAAYDGGVASVFKTVQGLSKNDIDFSSKREVLSKLFESNLKLRAELA
jgi:hypothetical protein